MRAKHYQIISTQTLQAGILVQAKYEGSSLQFSAVVSVIYVMLGKLSLVAGKVLTAELLHGKQDSCPSSYKALCSHTLV